MTLNNPLEFLHATIIDERNGWLFINKKRFGIQFCERVQKNPRNNVEAIEELEKIEYNIYVKFCP